MSVVNSFIQMNRVNVRDTITTFVMDSPSGITCGQSMTFSISTKYLTDYISGGIVYIIDNDTKEIIGEAPNLTGATNITVNKIVGSALKSGVIGEDGYAFLFGDRNVFALFSGVPDTWRSSFSATQKCYVQKGLSHIVSDVGNSHTQSVAIDGYYQFNLSQALTVLDYVDGYVDFRLYTNNQNYTNLETYPLQNINHGHAIAKIPAGTMTIGIRYYLAAFYRGNGCIGPSNTDFGVAGFYIDATA